MKKKVLGYLGEDLCNKFNITQFKNKKIVVYADRYIHFEKHKYEYKNLESYQKTINSLQQLIANPNFIYFNNNTSGLEFFGKVDEDVLVAIRADVSAHELKVKSVYPVNQQKINSRKKII